MPPKKLVASKQTSCDSILKQAKITKNTECNVADEDKTDPEACAQTEGETLIAWAEKWKVHYEAKLKAVTPKEKKCKDMKDEVTKLDAPLDKGEKESCAWKKKTAQDKGQQCTNVRAKVKVATCGFINNLEELCRKYRSCYDENVRAYNDFKSESEKQIESQKLQWRLLKRADCLAGAYNKKGEVDEKKLEKCAVVKTHNTSHLDLTYPELPNPRACNANTPSSIDQKMVSLFGIEGLWAFD